MAWNECKLQARVTIDNFVKNNGVSAIKAIREVSKELDIPSSTLKKWYYPGDNGSKNGPKTGVSRNTGRETTSSSTEVLEKIDPKKVGKNFSDAVKMCVCEIENLKKLSADKELKDDSLFNDFENKISWMICVAKGIGLNINIPEIGENTVMRQE